MKRASVVLVLFLSLVGLNCQTTSETYRSTENGKGGVPTYGYEVVHTWPHDTGAYTQGLVFHDGNLLESTGQVGRSSLRLVKLESGEVLKNVTIPAPYFAEGLTLLNGRLYQLTWQHQRGFIYDATTFEKTGEFSYPGEGWGLTNDGNLLILSDGSHRLRFLNPENFQVAKTISVLAEGKPVASLNELEFVNGEIYANIWHADRIARIEARTGRVLGWIEMKGLLSRSEIYDEEAVLNGIAFDAKNGRLFVTGKLWPKLFEIRVKP
ncbi:MAG: glutaminyl-peptide cyclotransferase [Pyrinomonadaceae bacterium]